MMWQERKARGWTQEYVAEQVGITPEAVSMMETGLRKPSYDVLVRLLDLFEYNDPRKLFEAATSSIEKQPGGNRAEPTTKE